MNINVTRAELLIHSPDPDVPETMETLKARIGVLEGQLQRVCAELASILMPMAKNDNDELISALEKLFHEHVRVVPANAEGKVH